jgi:hypothetical protein
MNYPIRVYSLDKLKEVNRNIIENYTNPYVWKVKLYFNEEITNRQRVKEKPVSRIKKFFNLFKKK